MDIKNLLLKSKLCLGPMSKNIVDTLIYFSNETKIPITLIPSRRQIEWDGGYVNNWKTQDFSEYVKSKSKYITLQRDHAGPGQGLYDDDGYESLKHDCKYFDAIHIDPWKKYSKFEDGLEWTINLLKFCYNENKNLYYEVCTEEAIRKFTHQDVDNFLNKLKKNLSKEIFDRILFCVIQSGTALQNGINTGDYNNERLMKMLEVTRKYNMKSKEHNGDYMESRIMIDRFNTKLDAINIAPELGVVETKIIFNYLKENNCKDEIELFYKLCYESGKWKKWVSNDFKPEENKEKLIEICGHYVFSHKDFGKVKKLDDNIIKNEFMKYVSELYGNIKSFLNRRNNVLTNEDTMEDIFTLKDFPVSMSCVDPNYGNYKYLDKTFQICKKTGIIQLKEFPSLDDMYLTPHNSTSYGSVWKNMFDIVSKKVNDLVNENNFKNILEIGGGSLLLASKILENQDINKYIVYEKNSSELHTKDKRLQLYKQYFTKETKIDENVDIVIHSHVLEHTLRPVDFINRIKKLKPKYHIIVVPNLYLQFQRKYTNSFNFEHNILITEPHIDVLLENNNFEIMSKQYYLDHSIIYVTKYNNSEVDIQPYPNLYNEYKKLVFYFKNYHEMLIIQINNQLDSLKGNVFLFGGHIFSLYLIKFGLNTDKIINIIDNSKEKEGLKLYGTDLIVRNPSIIKGMEKVIVIVKAASYQKEVEKQLRELNKDVIIIT